MNCPCAFKLHLELCLRQRDISILQLQRQRASINKIANKIRQKIRYVATKLVVVTESVFIGSSASLRPAVQPQAVTVQGFDRVYEKGSVFLTIWLRFY